MRKGKWTCADLRKSRTHTLFDTILLLIIVSSYIPQLQLIFARNSTAGITKSYVLFTYLFTATQFILVMIYSSYGRPIADCIKDGELTGMDAYSVVVGPVQMTVLWLGSLFLLATFLIYPNQSSIVSGLQSTVLLSDDSTVNQRPPYPRTLLFVYVLHTCVLLLPTLIITAQRPVEEPFHLWGLFVGFCDWYLIPACIYLVVLIFPLQIIELLASADRLQESCLSPTTLALQMIGFILLGWSWKASYGKPGDPFNITPPGATQLSVLYQFGGWQWVNNMIFGVGQGLLLLIYSWVASRQQGLRGFTQAVDETTALL